MANIKQAHRLEKFCHDNEIKFWPQPVSAVANNSDLSLRNLLREDWDEIKK
jgi:hypothetical protein